MSSSSSSYSSKLSHMRTFEPLLRTMITKLERRTPASSCANDPQLEKMKSLLHVLVNHDHKRRPMPMETLDRCREVLVKLHNKVEEEEEEEQQHFSNPSYVEREPRPHLQLELGQHRRVTEESPFQSSSWSSRPPAVAQGAMRLREERFNRPLLDSPSQPFRPNPRASFGERRDLPHRQPFRRSSKDDNFEGGGLQRHALERPHRDDVLHQLGGPHRDQRPNPRSEFGQWSDHGGPGERNQWPGRMNNNQQHARPDPRRLEQPPRSSHFLGERGRQPVHRGDLHYEGDVIHQHKAWERNWDDRPNFNQQQRPNVDKANSFMIGDKRRYPDGSTNFETSEWPREGVGFHPTETPLHQRRGFQGPQRPFQHPSRELDGQSARPGSHWNNEDVRFREHPGSVQQYPKDMERDRGLLHGAPTSNFEYMQHQRPDFDLQDIHRHHRDRVDQFGPRGSEIPQNSLRQDNKRFGHHKSYDEPQNMYPGDVRQPLSDPHFPQRSNRQVNVTRGPHSTRDQAYNDAYNDDSPGPHGSRNAIRFGGGGVPRQQNFQGTKEQEMNAMYGKRPRMEPLERSRLHDQCEGPRRQQSFNCDFESPASPPTETPQSPDTPASPPPTVVRGEPKVIPLERQELEEDRELKTQKAIRALSGNQSKTLNSKEDSDASVTSSRSRLQQIASSMHPHTQSSSSSPNEEQRWGQRPKYPSGVMLKPKRPQTYGEYKRMKEAMVRAETERMRLLEKEELGTAVKTEEKEEQVDDKVGATKDENTAEDEGSNCRNDDNLVEDDDSEPELQIAEPHEIETAVEHVNEKESTEPPQESIEKPPELTVQTPNINDQISKQTEKKEEDDNSQPSLTQKLINSLAEEDASKIEDKLRQRALKSNKLTLKELKALLMEEEDEDYGALEKEEKKKSNIDRNMLLRVRERPVKESKEQDDRSKCADKNDRYVDDIIVQKTSVKKTRSVRRSQRLQRESIAISSEDEPALMIDEGPEAHKEDENDSGTQRDKEEQRKTERVEKETKNTTLSEKNVNKGGLEENEEDEADLGLVVDTDFPLRTIQDDAVSSSTTTEHAIKPLLESAKKEKEGKNEREVDESEHDDSGQKPTDIKGQSRNELMVKTEVHDNVDNSRPKRERRSTRKDPVKRASDRCNKAKGEGKKSKTWFPKGERGAIAETNEKQDPVNLLDDDTTKEHQGGSSLLQPKHQPVDTTVFLGSNDVSLEPLHAPPKPTIDNGLRERLSSLHDKSLTSLMDKLNQPTPEIIQEGEVEMKKEPAVKIIEEKSSGGEIPLIMHPSDAISHRLDSLLQSVQDSLGLKEASKDSLDNEEMERKARTEEKKASILPFVKQLKSRYNRGLSSNVFYDDPFFNFKPQLGDEAFVLQIENNVKSSWSEEVVLQHDMNDFFKCNGCSYSTDETEPFLSHLYSDEHALDLVEEPRPLFLQCIYCGKHAASQQKLLIHLIKYHGNTKYQCGHCYLRAFTLIQIIVHLQHAHPDREPLFVLSKHIPLDDDYFEKFQEDSEEWNDNEESQGVSRRRAGRKAMCVICLESFNTWLSFVLHVTAEHPSEPIICKLLGANEDDDFEELTDDGEEHDKGENMDDAQDDEESIEGEGNDQTPVESVSSSQPNDSTRSSNHIRRLYSCVLCGFEDETHQVMKVRQHMRNVHKVVHTKVVNVKSNITHTQRSTSKVDEKVKNEHQKCLLVPKRAQLGVTRSKGSNTFYPSDLDSSVIPQNSAFMKAVRCGLCDFTTKLKVNLLHHLRLHKRNEISKVPLLTPVNPPSESKELAASKMQSLIASDHQEDDVKRVLSRKELDALPALVDEKQRFRCSDCIYATTDVNMLLNHMQTLHDTEEYKCPHCPSSSPIGLCDLEFHLNCHGPLLFCCIFCDFYHWQKRVAEAHVATQHPVRRPIVKDVRAEEAKRAKIEEEELKALEALNTKSDSGQSSVTTSTTVYEPFKCGLCNESKPDMEGIHQHLKEDHGIEDFRQFGCALCPTFRSDCKVNMEDHFKELHASGNEKGWKAGILMLRYFTVDPTSCASKESDQEVHRPLWSREVSGPRHIRGILYEDEDYADVKDDLGANDSKPDLKEDDEVVKLESDTSKVDVDLVETETASTEYECIRCGVKKQSVDSLKTHIRLIHLRSGKLLCRKCDFSANLESSMATHFTINHPDVEEPDFEKRKDADADDEEENDNSRRSEEFWKTEWNIPTEEERNKVVILTTAQSSPNKIDKGKKRKVEGGLSNKKKNKKITKSTNNNNGSLPTAPPLNEAAKSTYQRQASSDSNDMVALSKESTSSLSSVSLFENVPTYKCNFCPKRSQNIDLLRQHLISSHQVSEGHKELSRDEVVDLLTAKLETKEEHQRIYQCYFCDHVISDIETLRSHHREEHKEGSFKIKSVQGKGVSGYMECQLCGHLTSGLERSAQKLHYHEEHPEITQILCSKYLVSGSSSETSGNASSKRTRANWARFNGTLIACVHEECKFKATNVMTMLTHLKKHIQSFKCGHCGLTHRSLVDFNTHSALLHGDKIPDQVKDPEAEAEYAALRALMEHQLLNSTTNMSISSSQSTMSTSSSPITPPTMLTTTALTTTPSKRNTARKSTSGRQLPKRRLLTARKSTSKSPRSMSLPFSNYGHKSESLDLSRIATRMTVAGLEIPLSAKKMAELINLDVRVQVDKDLLAQMD